MRWTVTVIVCGLAVGENAGAQSERQRDVNALGWFVYDGDHKLTRRIGIHFDAQVRREDLVLSAQDFVLRPGINVHLSDSTTLTAAYGYVRTYPYGDFPDESAYPEHRIHEQVSTTHSAWGWDVEHRFRLEHRFVSEEGSGSGADLGGWRYQNRFRYAMQPRRTLPRSLYLQTSIEPMLRFGVRYRGRAFDQQRLYGGIGCCVGSDTQFEVGYLYQFGVPRRGRVYEHNHVFQITITSAAPLFRGARKNR